MAARERLPLLGILLGVLLAVPALPSTAQASKYIVVLDIEGERTPRLQKTIARMVKSAHKVMAGSAYRNASRRLRAQKLTPTNVKRVCEYLEADGIIDGTLVKQSGRYKFTLRLRSGVTGAITKKIPMLINQPGLSSNMAQQLEQKLLVAIDSLPRAGGSKGRVKERIEDVPEDDFEDEEVDDAPSPKMTRAERRRLARERLRERKEAERAARDREADAKAEREARAREKADAKAEREARAREEAERDADLRAERRRKARERLEKRREAREDSRARDRDDEDDGPSDEAGFEDDEPMEEDFGESDDDEKPRRAAMRDVADEDDDSPLPKASASVSADAKSESKATDIATTPVLLTAGVSAIGRTLSFNHAGDAADAPNGYRGKPVPGLFAQGEIYPMAFGGKDGLAANIGVGFVVDRAVGLKSQVADGMGGTANLATRQSKYGASLRYRHNLGSVIVYGSVGYNKLSFIIDKSAAPDGVVVDVPNVAYGYVDPGVGARIPFGKFALLAEARFMAVLSAGEVQLPEEYGAATITGFEGDGGVEYRITDHILARAGVHATMLGYAFKGNGAMLDRDGDGSNDVGGAADRFLGGYVTAGYAF